MGRGGGGGGGHRSSGGGHSSRSFGGTSSSHARGGSSGRSVYRGGSVSHGAHYNLGGHPYRGPGIHVNHHYHHGGGSWGILPTVVSLLIVGILIFALVQAGGTGNVRKSTVERRPLEPYAAFEKDCVDDDAGWIHDRGTLLSGMEDFYKRTGIQPALSVHTDIDGQKYLKDGEVEAFMGDTYDSLIGHERGLLLLFCEYADSDWYAYYMAGEDAQTVMDSEACGILMDQVHALYADSSLSDEEFFSQVFERTGDRIMSVTPTLASKVPVIVAGAVIIALGAIGFRTMKARHAREAERARETERILNSDIDRL